MSALCQDSLARQQNINCFQLAEFPSLSRGCGQSEAGLVEQSTFTVATAPLYLCSLTLLHGCIMHSSHRPLCLRQMVNITPTGEVKLAVAAAQGEVNPEPSRGGGLCVFCILHPAFGKPFPNKPGLIFHIRR